MSNVKDVAMRQTAQALNSAAEQIANLRPPQKGWISMMRKALGMSAPALAQRLGVTKPAIYQAERKERDGGITLKHMERIAEAMDGRFVYAIVPNRPVETILHDQARAKAEAIVQRASSHMALEKQSLSSVQNQTEIDHLTAELLRQRPSDFWRSR